MAKKMWGGRYSKETDKIMEAFNASISFDKRLYKQDIKGSIAHCAMLAQCKIISAKESARIIRGLKSILKDMDEGAFVFKTELEDIHMNIESELINRIGDSGKKLHTARSRNDQNALDMHMYVKDETLGLSKLLLNLLESLLNLALKNPHTIIPAMTHLQHAQSIYFSHHILAYFFMFERDLRRLENVYLSADSSPLGAGALAGSAFPINPNITARLLGFSRIYENSMDAVSDRDYILEFLGFASLLMMHASRFCEEIILWSSDEFSFIELDDAFSTGSSMMPQKKNPDAAELIRGKSGRIFGHLIAMLATMKALPLAYNKDMQEDKECLFDAVDNIKAALAVFAGMIDTLKINEEGIERAFERDYSNATDMADYLAKKGLPFRQAHHICGQAVALALSQKKTLQKLDLADLQKLSPLFQKDIFGKIDIEFCVQARNSAGATSKKQINAQIKTAKARLSAFKKKWNKPI